MNSVPIKKVPFHDDSFVEHINSDTAPLSSANDGPDTDVYTEEVNTQGEL